MTSYFCIPVPYNETDIYFGLVLKGLVDLHSSSSIRSTSDSSVLLAGALDLDYCDIEWFALETNRDHSVIFEIAAKYCILGSFVDYDDYSISSKVLLPTVVDTMVI